MSEQLLQSLMQLFAIISRLDGEDIRNREVVEKFLSDQLNLETTDYFLQLFDQYLEERAQKSRQRKTQGISVRDSSRMLLICTQINEELTQQQKFSVIFSLFSIITADEGISDDELEFLGSVADVFNIEQEEYQAVKSFILDPELQYEDRDNLLIINERQEPDFQHTHHIRAPQIRGYLAVLRIPSVDMYAVKYVGDAAYELNGIQMARNEVSVLTTGSIIKGTKLNPIYFSDVVSKFMRGRVGQQVAFEAEGVSYKFPNGKVGLHELTIREEAGRMTGIMGPSGAGKSTLLEVLNGNQVPSTGSVTINGIDIHRQPKDIEGIIGYVPQDDLLIEELTVYQNLFYAAKLSFGKLKHPELHEIVQQTLVDLGISHIADLKVGNVFSKTISGGERKRVNIGLELLRAPSVMFVDEPTSGLSSRDSLNIMGLLKELALRGKLIFVVIHQPSSDIFKMLDRLVILDYGGYPIYYGNPVEAVVYFKSRVNQINKEQAVCPECGNVNVEQIFDIVETNTVNPYGQYTNIRKISPEQWNQFFRQHIALPPKQEGLEPLTASHKIASILRQLNVFIKRDFISKISDAQYMSINLLQAPVLAGLLALVHRHYPESSDLGYVFMNNLNMPVYFFVSVIVAMFMGLTVSAEEIYGDRKILKREKFLNLSWSAYMVSKLAVLFAFSAVQTFTFVLVSDLILEIRGMNLCYWLVLFSISCFANVLGLNISSGFDSVVTIYILIPILLIPQLVLGGIVIDFDELNPDLRSRPDRVPWLGEVMASRWGFEALMVGQFRENEYTKHFFALDKQAKFYEYQDYYLLPKLESRLTTSREIAKKAKPTPKEQQFLQKNLKLLRYHLQEYAQMRPQFRFKKLDKLYPQQFTPKLAKATLGHLGQIKNHFVDHANKVKRKRDKKMGALIEKLGSKEALLELKRKYYNKEVAAFVKKNQKANRILEGENRFIQKVYPVYKKPEPTHFLDFRSQFYASQKHFVGYYFPTQWFNTIAIWVMSAGLYVLLYYEVLSRGVGYLSNIKRSKG